MKSNNHFKKSCSKDISRDIEYFKKEADRKNVSKDTGDDWKELNRLRSKKHVFPIDMQFHNI